MAVEEEGTIACASHMQQQQAPFVMVSPMLVGSWEC